MCWPPGYRIRGQATLAKVHIPELEAPSEPRDVCKGEKTVILGREGRSAWSSQTGGGTTGSGTSIEDDQDQSDRPQRESTKNILPGTIPNKPLPLAGGLILKPSYR